MSARPPMTTGSTIDEVMPRACGRSAGIVRVGTLAVAMNTSRRGRPLVTGIQNHMGDAETPRGWSKNPTDYKHRARLGILAFVGFGIALYLTLYQFRAYDSVWDPFFDSKKVVDATYPIPDALAGVIAYGAELLLLALGGRDRWRRLPWACLALGAVLTGGVVVSVALIVIQPTLIGHWCTLCLGSALVSFALFALGIDEARAAWQYVSRARQAGIPLGDAVWGRAGRVSV